MNVTFSDLQRAGSLFQKKAIKNKEIARAIRNNALFRIKESEILIDDSFQNTSSLYYCCSSCTPTSRVS
jgi:hypothetical protein